MKTISTKYLLIVALWCTALAPCRAFLDPETDTFLTPDPSGMADGTNEYTYVHQNPWTMFDPDGLAALFYNGTAALSKSPNLTPVESTLFVMGALATSPRAQAAVGAVGSGVEMAAGASTSPSLAGVAAFIHGADNLQANVRQIATNQPTNSVTEDTVTAVTGSPTAGSLVNAAAEAALTGGAGLSSAAADAESVAAVNNVRPDANPMEASSRPPAGDPIPAGSAPAPASASCFVAGTWVATPDGNTKIEDIKVGDMVLAYDFASGRVVERKVTATPRNFTYYWVNLQVGGETITATRHHRFWIESEKQWVDAMDLHAGMTVRLASGETMAIMASSMYEIQQAETTYNLVVEQDHDFFVGVEHVLVHNDYPVSPQYPPPTDIGENFQFNFDTSPGYGVSRKAGIKQAIRLGYLDPDSGPFHHINSVRSNPNLAAEPSNIQGMGSTDAHLDAHGGNWQNPTSGPLQKAPGC